MSSKVGKVYFAREKRNRFLNLGPEGAEEYSGATAELIVSEVREIIEQQYSKALEILKGKKRFLEKVQPNCLKTRKLKVKK